MIYNEKRIKMLKQRYPKGTRICLDSMENDPHSIPSGTKGTVQFVDDCGTIHCIFDNGRSLGVIPDEDVFHTIQQEEMEHIEDLDEDPEIDISMQS